MSIICKNVNNNDGDFMEILKICLTAVLSIIELFILTKLMGKRQISQLSLFDYVNGITIGSIAADMAFSPINEFWKPAVAIVVYGVFAVIFSFASNKSIKFRRFFVGKALVLMDNGTIYRKNFQKAKLDLNEFLTQCRVGGYFNIDDLQTVIMEANGQLSFLPKSTLRPINPNDLGLHPQKENAPHVVVSDGEILHENLKSCGKNEIWLRKELKEGKFPPIEKIYIAFVENDKISAYEIDNSEKGNDIFS